MSLTVTNDCQSITWMRNTQWIIDWLVSIEFPDRYRLIGRSCFLWSRSAPKKSWLEHPWFHCLLLFVAAVYIAQTTVYLHVCYNFLFISKLSNKRCLHLYCWTLCWCVCVCAVKWKMSLSPSLFWMASRMLSELHSMQGVVVQIWMKYFPTGWRRNMV